MLFMFPLIESYTTPVNQDAVSNHYMLLTCLLLQEMVIFPNYLQSHINSPIRNLPGFAPLVLIYVSFE